MIQRRNSSRRTATVLVVNERHPRPHRGPHPATLCSMLARSGQLQRPRGAHVLIFHPVVITFIDIACVVAVDINLPMSFVVKQPEILDDTVIGRKALSPYFDGLPSFLIDFAVMKVPIQDRNGAHPRACGSVFELGFSAPVVT
jgi:hypothetical protein